MVHRRRHERVKRRFACEFLAEGQRYRGIVVELSQGGLFVQTDATTAPGREIELQIAGSGAVPDLSLRAVVLRRRMVPAPLAAVVRRGIALGILYAPREYGLACGTHLLEAPIGSPGGDGVGSPRIESAPASAPAASGDRAPAAGRVAAAPPRTEAPPPPKPESPAGATPPGPPRPEVLVVDDGSLGDVVELLRELGVDPQRIELGARDAAPPIARPRRLLVTTARLACALAPTDALDEGSAVAIAVAQDASHTLSRMMRRLGFRYLVHRPTHPEALRLLLRKALHRGSEQRAAERLPFGSEVRWRSGWLGRPGILVEISAGSCRLLTERPLAPGSRIRIEIPREATGGRRIALRGRILRSGIGATDSRPLRCELAVGLDPAPARVQRRLDSLLERLARGPAALARAAADPPSPQPIPAPDARATTPDSEPVEPPPPGEDRRAPRVRLDREVLALDESGSRAVHALVGRDLSASGMRIDAHPELEVGQRLRVVLYEPCLPEPVVLDAEIARDDGGAGLALAFSDVPEPVSLQLGRIIAVLPAIEILRPEPQRIVLGEWLHDRPAA